MMPLISNQLVTYGLAVSLFSPKMLRISNILSLIVVKEEFLRKFHLEIFQDYKAR